MDERLVGKTKHAELSLDEIADLQPGMSEYMILMAHRYHVMYYAVRDGNFELGRLQLGGIRKILRNATKTRPKYKDAVEEFSREYLDPIERAMVARSSEECRRAIEASIQAGDAAHEKWGYAYIRYRIPDSPPAGYLTAPPPKK
jgi:hypothetical protein